MYHKTIGGRRRLGSIQFNSFLSSLLREGGGYQKKKEEKTQYQTKPNQTIRCDTNTIRYDMIRYEILQHTETLSWNFLFLTSSTTTREVRSCKFERNGHDDGVADLAGSFLLNYVLLALLWVVCGPAEWRIWSSFLFVCR